MNASLRPLPYRPASAPRSRRHELRPLCRPPNVAQPATCRPRCAHPSCQHVRRHRGRGRRDPRRLRAARRVLGRGRAAPVVPRRHRHRSGPRLCPDHRRMEAAARATALGEAAGSGAVAPRGGGPRSPLRHAG